MATFMKPPVVEYVCSCGLMNPITKLCFCRYCLKLRCGFCVCHEIDSHFCSNCLENIPSTEAKHKKNRCNSCFDCPSCQHTLTARATTVTVSKKPEDTPKEEQEDKSKKSTAGGDAKVLTRKMYYLACLSCRWTTRDVGIPDQTIATGSWPENEYVNQTRFNSLMEYYQSVVLLDKQEKQDYLRRKTPKQHKFPSLTDRTGLTISMIRRQMGWTDKTPPKPKHYAITASLASEDVDELPDTIFSDEINLKNITTIQQRHSQPADQPETVNKLFPQRKSLSIKRSLRCRQCEHNVIKPEYHPTSIKFRLPNFACAYIPDVRLIGFIDNDALQPGQLKKVLLKLTNPTVNDMTITIMDLPTPEEEILLIEDLKKSFEKSLSSISSTSSLITTGASVSVAGTQPTSLTTQLSNQNSLNEEPRPVNRRVTAKLELPDSSFHLSRKDDSTEYDEDIQMQRDEPKFIISRRLNKVTIQLNFTPDDNLESGDDVIIGFSMQFTHVQTSTNATEKKEPEHHALTTRVYIKVGRI